MGEAAESPGTSAARPRRLPVRAAFIAGLSLLLGLLQIPQATVAQARTGSGSRTASVALDTIGPVVPAKSGAITLSGTVTNDGRSTITDAKIGVRTAPGGPLSSRSALTAAASRTGYNATDGFRVSGSAVALADVPAGASRPFSLKVPVSELGLTDDGVYQLGVTVTGQSGSEPYQHVLGIRRTFLPWSQKGGAKPTRFTYLWPLIDRPHVAVRTQTDEQQSPIFLDDDLAGELAPGGRLQQMVDLGRNLPVTWVVDPDLLATVDFMTRGYRVAGPGGDLDHTTRGIGTDDAKLWLNGLKKATAGEEMVALPFGDPDIASIAHRGKDVPGALSHLKTATDLAGGTVDTVLGIRPTTSVAWPVEGAVDPSIVDVATAGGADTVIARNDSFGDGGLDYTPTSARSLTGGTTAVVADANLSNAFQGDMTRASEANLAVQQFVSQTLMITLQAPAKQRNVLVAPQRMPTSAQAQEMARAITTVGSGNWAETGSFDAAAKASPDPRAGHTVPRARAYPHHLRTQELSKDAFRDIQRTQNQLNRFVVILSRKDKASVPFGTAVLRSMSVSWRDDHEGAAAFRDSIRGYLTDLMGAVHILTKSTLTLSGRSATIPVTVKNDLGQAVNGLELRLTSGSEIRLEIGAAQPVTVEGGHTRSLKFPTTASANGLASVTAQLYTADGVKYGDPMTFTVNVTSVTDTVMLVIAGGLLLLVLAGVRLYLQRKRRTAVDDREDDDEEEDDGDDEDGEGGEEAEQPGDPAPDTSPESADPSLTGEKVDR